LDRVRPSSEYALSAPGRPQADHDAGGRDGTPRKPSRDLDKSRVPAHRWRRRIESGRAKSITNLAEHVDRDGRLHLRLVPLTCVAPDIVAAILDGRQPKGLRLVEMPGNGALGWEEQRVSWGL
jgi:hypothetical protein